MDFEEFVERALTPAAAKKKPTPTARKRTSAEIMAEFMPIVEADQRRGG